MGILTTKDSARSFSTYVALFGLALLITSSIYLKKLNKWEQTHSCVETLPENEKFSAEILCSNYYAWRRAAVIGIIIGVIDVLLIPFLLCCGCCLVCGCTMMFCACLKCYIPYETNQNEGSATSGNATANSGNATTTQPTSGTNDIELTPASPTPATAEADEEPDMFSKFNLNKLPGPLMKLLNMVGWAVWVLLPFVGTLLIVIWISDKEAIRTREDELYKAALAVFVVALLNLMVFYQKFIDSVCEYCCGSKKKEKKEDEAAEV